MFRVDSARRQLHRKVGWKEKTYANGITKWLSLLYTSQYACIVAKHREGLTHIQSSHVNRENLPQTYNGATKAHDPIKGIALELKCR